MDFLEDGFSEEVGSVVASRALYCATRAFGMIGMLIVSHVLPVDTLDEILRWLEVFYYNHIIPTYQYLILEMYT